MAGRALARGGCRALEVTFTTPDAVEAIAALVADGLFVGAGTILDEPSATAAWSAGAGFIVSPTELPQDQDKLVIPGALTPSEVLKAHRAGAQVIKIFPVESMGGPRYLKLLKDPLPFLRFFPTGGVTLEDAPHYLNNGAVAVGVGTALAPTQAIEDGDEAHLEALARTWASALY